MTKRIKLTTATIAKLDRPGRYSADCHGLALTVRKLADGRISRSWVQRVRYDGRPTNVGLGAWPLVSLKLAREHAMANALATITRSPLPFGPRKHHAAVQIPTLREAAAKVIESRAPTWSGPRVASDWRSTFEHHVFPKLGTRTVDSITTADVLGVLTPIWHSKRSRAKSVRSRLSVVMQWARAHGYRTDDPCDSRIDGALPANGHATKHRESLPWQDVPDAWSAVLEVNGTQRGAALMLQFVMLTGARRDEARMMQWSEVSGDVWTVPAERMKMRRAHQVPLSPAALEVLAEARRLGCKGDFVFCGARGGRVADTAAGTILRKLEVGSTLHGFRSSLRSFAADRGYPAEVAEAALAHAESKTVRAYQRSGLLEARRPLMNEWAEHVTG